MNWRNRLTQAWLGGMKSLPGLLMGKGWEVLLPTMKFSLTRKLTPIVTHSGYVIETRQQLMSWWGLHIQASLFDGWSLKDGDVVLDIGANYGVFGWEVKQRYPGVRVFGFEPDKRLANYCTSLKCNGVPVYERVVCAALSDRNGTAELLIRSHEGSWTATLIDNPDNVWEEACVEPTSKEQVNTVRLDDLWSRGMTLPTLVKIDVDGGELLVMSGGYQTIRRVKYVVCELAGEKRVKEFEALIGRRGRKIDSGDYLFKL